MRATRLLLAVLTALAGCLVGVACLIGGGDPLPPRRVAPDPQAPSVILADWDSRRASAFAAGDPGSLERLYLSGSDTARNDLALLESWRDRGLRVEGMQRQVLDIDVVDRSPSHLKLAVTDRLAGAVAVGDHTRTPLPAAQPVTRTIRLHQRSGTWLVAEVTR